MMKKIYIQMIKRLITTAMIIITVTAGGITGCSLGGNVEAWRDKAFEGGIVVPGSDLKEKLVWLQNNVTRKKQYCITINADEFITPQTLSYTNEEDITVIIKGDKAMRIVTVTARGSLFTVDSGVTLILDNNITLNGMDTNNASLVTINSGGTLIMNTETKITGNSNTNIIIFPDNTSIDNSSGGGVQVYGTFFMNGGEISGNKAYNGGGIFLQRGGTFNMNTGKITSNTNNSNGGGGGVYVTGSGTFNMKGGEISGNVAVNRGGGGIYLIEGTFNMSGGIVYGNNAPAGLKNAASEGTALWKYTRSTTAQYGTFSGDTFYPSAGLATTNTTIHIVNGTLLTN